MNRPSATLALQDLIAEHGRFKVLLAALRASFAPRPEAPASADLSDYLMRDIGLPPEPRAPRYWELR